MPRVEEVFVKIPGYENYEVSNYGNVVNAKTDKDVKPMEKRGKFLVKLYSNGVAKRFFIHRLVAQAFFVDYDDEVDVYHVSDDKHDNCITNLHLVKPYK